MSKLHREMRPWRAHLKEVPLSEIERLAYLRFIYGNIQEKSSEWFDKRDINEA